MNYNVTCEAGRSSSKKRSKSNSGGGRMQEGTEHITFVPGFDCDIMEKKGEKKWTLVEKKKHLKGGEEDCDYLRKDRQKKATHSEVSTGQRGGGRKRLRCVHKREGKNGRRMGGETTGKKYKWDKAGETYGISPSTSCRGGSKKTPLQSWKNPSACGSENGHGKRGEKVGLQEVDH